MIVIRFAVLPIVGATALISVAAAQQPAKPPATTAAPAVDSQPTLLGQYADWGAYTASPTGGKVCFALSKPISSKTEPAGRKREPAYIFVATRPAENVKNELSVIVGYPFKSTSDATAEIGTAKFAMYKSLPAPHARTLASRARGIVNASSGITSSGIEENVDFWIDEAKRSLVLADGTPLIVHRFDDRWISAARGDVSYELDRQGGNLTYAGLTTKDGVTTIIIGSGRCKPAPAR